MELSGWNCPGGVLTGTIWSGIVGDEQSLGELFGWNSLGWNSEVELSGLELFGVELSGVELSRVELSRVELSGVELSGVELSRWNYPDLAWGGTIQGGIV